MVVLLLPEAATASTTTTRIIVKRDPGLTATERADIRADAGVRHVESLPLPRSEVVRAAPGGVRSALRDLNKDPDVEYAEIDRGVHATSDDEYFGLLWGLRNLGGSVQEAPATIDADMDVPLAWQLSTGQGVTVAVVDTGVDATHPDLEERVAAGYDLVDDDSDARDTSGHGTHVAGTLAATKDNQVGVAGVAAEARILPLRVLGTNLSGSLSDVVKAFDFAGDRGIRIVNASFSATGFSQSEHDVLASHPATLFVVGAGNSSTDLDAAGTADEYPCAYDLSNILCVGASRPDDTRLVESNYGAQSVDVFAPGYGIYSTMPGGAYAYKSGTSMATAHIAGAAALLLARNPGLTAAELKGALIQGSDDKQALAGLSVSDGRANADRPMRYILDGDGDGLTDGLDNCPSTSNPDQADTDENGVGDACDPPPADADRDGIATPGDACAYEAAAYASDGCPGVGPDTDRDGQPDVFDATPRGHNSDGDHVAALDDACPDVYGTLANGCPAPPPPPPPPPPPNRDGDNRIDAIDACATEYAISNDGCPLPQIASVDPRVRKRGKVRSVTVTVKTTRLATVGVTIQRKRGRRWVRVKASTVASVANRASVVAKRLVRGRYRVRVTISNGAGSGTRVTEGFRVL